MIHIFLHLSFNYSIVHVQKNFVPSENITPFSKNRELFCAKTPPFSIFQGHTDFSYIDP